MNDEQEMGVLLCIDMAESNEGWKLALNMKWRMAVGLMAGNDFAWPKVFIEGTKVKRETVCLETA